jgi:hypothetical protein
MEPRANARLDRYQASKPATREGETVTPHDAANLVTATRLDTPGRLLAAMPLHAITAVHGEAGLRQRLLIETRRLPAAERARIGTALALMSRLHQVDRRQREPYACHPLRVTIRVLSHYRVTDRTRSARPCCMTPSRTMPRTSHPSVTALRVRAAAQRSFHEISGALDGRQASALRPVGLQGGVQRVRRSVLGKLGPDTAVSRAGALNAAVDVMADDERKDDRVPAHHVVLTEFGRQGQEPGNGGGFPSRSAWRAHFLRPA